GLPRPSGEEPHSVRLRRRDLGAGRRRVQAVSAGVSLCGASAEGRARRAPDGVVQQLRRGGRARLWISGRLRQPIRSALRGNAVSARRRDQRLPRSRDQTRLRARVTIYTPLAKGDFRLLDPDGYYWRVTSRE